MQPRNVLFGTNTWLALVKVLVSAALLVIVSRNVDFDELANIVGRIQFWAIATVLILMASQTCVQGARWRFVIAAISGPMPLGRIMRLTFVGVFFNQVLPTSLGGDAVRTWYLHRDGVRLLSAFNSILVERVWGVAALSVMVFAGMVYLDQRLANDPLRFGLMAVLPLCLLGMAAIVCLAYAPATYRKWRPIDTLARLGADARPLFASPGLALPLLLISIVGHSFSALTVYVLSDGLGLNLSIWECFAIVPSVLLTSLIPLSFAGWGLREGAMIVMLGYLGLDTASALAVSIAFGLSLAGGSLPGLGFWLQWRRSPEQVSPSA